MIDAFPEGTDLISNLKQLKEAAENLDNVTKRGLFKKLNDGDLQPNEAIDLVNSNPTKINDLKKIMKFYENDEQALQT